MLFKVKFWKRKGEDEAEYGRLLRFRIYFRI